MASLCAGDCRCEEFCVAGWLDVVVELTVVHASREYFSQLFDQELIEAGETFL